MTITTPEVLDRNWGQEVIIAWTPTHAGKLLRRKKGTKGGFQLHVKEENHYVLEGSLRLRWLDSDGTEHQRIVTAGHCWTVSPGRVHQEEALEDSIIIEVSDPTQDDRYAVEPDPGGLPSMTDAEAVKSLRRLVNALDTRACRLENLAASIQRCGLYSLVPKRPIEEPTAETPWAV